jgi:hypothetical protein
MALLDTASLIVTPNGYKASKLYSIVPSDGTGDMTFSRTGNTATRVNSSGLIETVNANIPRLDYTDSTCPKLLMEPQRTNLLRQSSDFTTTWSTSSGTVSGNTVISLDGTQNADTLTGGRYQNTFASNTYTASIFAKKVDGDFSLLIRFDTPSLNFGQFNLNTGTITSVSSGYSAKIIPYPNGWYRCSVTTPVDTAITNLVFVSANLGVNSTYVWGAQLEVGSFSTSYIPTTTASVTRNADGCSKTSATALIGQTEGAMVIDVDINSRISSTQFMLRNTAVTSYISFIITSSVIQCAIYNASTQTVTINFTNSSTGRFKLGVAYKLNDVAYYVNGSLIGTDTSTDIPEMTEIDLYFNASNFLKVNSFTHWKTRLTNSELAQLTTL